MGSDSLREPLAKEYLQLNELWNKTDKNIISDNVRKFVGNSVPGCQDSFNALWEYLVEITNANKHTVYAWLNRSRDNVKIPLINLCKLADAMSIDVMDFFKR